MIFNLRILKSSPAIQIIILTVFISFKFLLSDNMGQVNELDLLPSAKQYASPSWIPEDWYLNQPPGYRFLFQIIFGSMAVNWGFLATSILGRLICYILIASGLVLIARKLGLSFLSLLFAVGLFIYVSPHQGVVAYEWLIGALEPKSIAYGLILIAISFILYHRYLGMMLLLGLATSFHVLVGGWTFLAVTGWFIFKQRNDFPRLSYCSWLLLMYLVGSVFAIKPVLNQLFDSVPQGDLLPSQIYVFMRSPHHLSPLSWHFDWWIKPLVYLLVLFISIKLLQGQKYSQQGREQYQSRMELAVFTIFTLIPFILGLAIAPFDTEAKLLQYYPFRLGDIMLPLNTCLLFTCALQQSFQERGKRLFALSCILLLSLACTLQFGEFQENLQTLFQFPSAEMRVNSQLKELYAWIRKNTSTNAVIISPPVDLINFTWLAERPTIAKYKLIPHNKSRIFAWYERLSDLSGDVNPWPSKDNRKANKNEIKQALTNGYNSLTTAQVEGLMIKYQAEYFLSHPKHLLDLPVAYSNSDYILYGKPSS